jgi:Ca2+-binding RTX toxin-like protein
MTTTKNPLDGLLAIRNGSISARWNFYDAVGTPVSSPGGIGNVAAVSFSFLTSLPDYYSSTPTTGFTQFSELQKQAARDVLASIANVVHLSFSEVSGIGDMTFAMNAQSGSSGYAYFPSFSYYFTGETITSVSAAGVAGDVWLNSSISWTADNFVAGGSGYGALVHELGHALGLKHSFEATTDGYILDASLDNTKYTVMSYTPHPYSYYRTVNQTGPGSYSWQYELIQPETLMPLDIKALQYLYGANTSFHSGNDTYTFDSSRPFIRTIWDGGGNDTISVSNFSLGCEIDLRAGYFSCIRIPSDPLPPGQIEGNSGIYDGTDNLGIAYGSIIENATGGSGDDQLNGNALANVLSGNAGADKLEGRGGADTMIGGNGSDTYFVRDSGDVVIEDNAKASSGGTDLVNSYLNSYTLGINVENGRIMSTGVANLTGNKLNNILTGNSAANILIGNAGTDKLTGGGGADQLTGGPGGDILTGGANADRFIFLNITDSGVSSTGRDTITDFKSMKGDKIDLSAIDANTSTAGNDAFTSLDQGVSFTNSFINTASLYFDQTAKILYANNDIDVQADFSILLTGVSGVSLGYFVL